MTTDTDLLERITVRADVFGGKPIIHATCASRIMEHVLGMLACIWIPLSTILEQYPDLEPEDTTERVFFLRTDHSPASMCMTVCPSGNESCDFWLDVCSALPQTCTPMLTWTSVHDVLSARKVRSSRLDMSSPARTGEQRLKLWVLITEDKPTFLVSKPIIRAACLDHRGGA